MQDFVLACDRKAVNVTNLPTELVHEIASLLPLSSRRALAVSSRVLSDPSLKALWTSLPDLIYVFQLLSGLTYDVASGHWMVPGEIDNHDLVRFRYYAKFVKEHLPPFPPIESRLIQKLLDANPILFPGLSKFHSGNFNSGSFTHGSTSFRLISASIEEISLDLSGPDSLRDTALPASLRSLTLMGTISPSDFEPLLFCSNLQEMKILPIDPTPDITERAISVARSLPNLRKLSLIAASAVQADHKRTTLSSLTLRGRPSHLASIIDCFSGLQDVTLDIRHSGQLEEIACISCFKSLASLSAASLTSIKFRTSWRRYREPFPLSKCLQYLNPLCGLKSLAIGISTRPLMALHDAVAIARTWPQLEELQITACLTDRGLRVMASMPCLNRLSVGVGRSGIFTLPFAREFDICSTPEVEYARNLFSPTRSVHSANKTVNTSRALSPELLQTVFDYARPSDLWTLLTVSKHINTVARRRLWRNLPSLVPLLKLLPGTLLLEGRIYRWKYGSCLPAASEFDKFDLYAALVESIVDDIFNCPLDRYQVHESVYELLRRLRPGHNTLPNLRVFGYFQPKSPCASLVIPFLSIALECVSLDVKDDCTHHLLGEIQRICPTVTEIRLSGLLTADLVTALQGFPRLSALSLNFKNHYYDQYPPVQYSRLGAQVALKAFNMATRALESTNNLRSLAYNIPYTHRPFPAPQGRWLSTVTGLRLEGGLKDVQEHLSAFSNLETVSLHFDPYEASDRNMGHTLERCCNQLEAHSGHSLWALSISCRSLSNIFEYMQSLWRIPGMRCFGMRLETLDFGGTLPHLQRCDTLKIALHWPLLNDLIFTGRYGGFPSSLDDLLPLTSLPELTYLEVEGAPYPMDPCDLNFEQAQYNNYFADIVFPGARRAGHDTLALHDVLARPYVNPVIVDF